MEAYKWEKLMREYETGGVQWEDDMTELVTAEQKKKKNRWLMGWQREWQMDLLMEAEEKGMDRKLDGEN